MPMDVDVTGEVIHWRGPAPHHFVAMPEPLSAELRDQPELSYGWGCVPVTVTLGRTTFQTSLMPKGGVYLVPLKAAVRRAEGIDIGDEVSLRVRVGAPARR